MLARILFSRTLPLAVLLVIGVAVSSTKPAAQAPHSPQAKQTADPVAAIRANNLGAAYMNQQRMELALAEFEKAYAADPKLAAARVNQGIALLNLQRIEPARAILREIAARDVKNIRAWYNLGILEKNAGDAEASLAAFEKAAALDPADADTRYFIGTLLAQLGRYPDAIAAFEHAIALNRFHVSAEFGLARAMQRSGNAEQARVHLARFQHLNTEKLGAPMSLAYGDQGPYSLAETVTLPPSAATPPIPVRFNSVPAYAPLSLPGRPPAPPTPKISGLPAGTMSSGKVPYQQITCTFDFDSDGWSDLLVTRPDTPEHVALLRNSSGRYSDATSGSGLALASDLRSCAAGDFNNDGHLDLMLGSFSGLHLFNGNGAGRFEDFAAKAGLSEKSPSLALTLADYDHDGDLDLISLPRGPNLFRNNGNGTFTDQTSEAGWQGLGEEPWGAIPSDLNNDRAVDFFVPRILTAPVLMRNRREGPFESHSVSLKDSHWTALAAIADLDRDGWMDVAATIQTSIRYIQPSKDPEQEKSQPLVVLRNRRGTSFEELNLGIGVTGANPTGGLAVFDFDNDGWQDLALLYEDVSETTHLLLLRNRSGNRFEDVAAKVDVPEMALSISPLDFDNDGDTDLAIADIRGSVLLLRNDGGNRNNWVKLSLKGLADNKSAIGTKVEVFAGASYQKFEVTTPNDLLIGLGQEKQADVVRLLWPTGVLQDEVNLAANQRHEIVEIDRRGSSCPILFAWNGSRYEFIADAVGPGIVGHWVAPGVRNTSDPTEYIKVPGSLLHERRSARGERRLSFRFAEPMEEIVYLDQLRLFAVDHPQDTEVNPSERFYASGPPFPTGEPVFTAPSNARPPVRVVDHRGRDVTALVRARDRRYVTGFADAPYKGFAETHWIELDLRAAVAAAQPLRLLLHGYTDYFTATSVYAAHQGGITAIVPYVEALTPEGQWVRVEDDMGFPAGLARTMVADLTGKLPPGARRIRIVTNLKIYWDQILIDSTPAVTPHRISEAPLAAATSDFLGYPREIRGTPESDIRYDYHSVSATGPYARAAGHYTRYGDVRALVTASDDRFVIMGSGDEVAVEFDPAALPPLPAGWTRDWFVYVDGFAKDMDFYAAHPFTVTPLPYHAMPGYPYPEERGYPADRVHLEDQLELDTRAVSGRAAPSYRYHYAGRAAPSSQPQPPRRTLPRK